MNVVGVLLGVRKKRSAVLCRDLDSKVIVLLELKRKRENCRGSHIYCSIDKQLAVLALDDDFECVSLSSDVDSDLVLFSVECSRRVKSCTGGVAYSLRGIPELREALGLVGCEPGEVGLVIGIAACHELCVLSVSVGELLFPVVCVRAVAPGKHLLTGRYMVVCDMENTAVLDVVKSTEEIKFGGCGEIGGRVSRILMPAYVLRLGDVIRSVLSRCDRECGMSCVIVVMNICNVGWEYESVALVYCDCGILPPQEAVLIGSAVADLHASLKVVGVGAKHNTYHSLGPIARRMLGEPYDRASVIAFFYIKIHGHYGRGAVMEGPVELNSSRDPRAVRTDKRRLYNVLTVQKVVSRDLIVRLEDPSSECGNDCKTDVLVFKSDDRPFLVRAVLAVCGRHDSVGVRIARSSLMHAGLCKHRHLFCFGYRIRRYRPLLNCNVNR